MAEPKKKAARKRATRKAVAESSEEAAELAPPTRSESYSINGPGGIATSMNGEVVEKDRDKQTKADIEAGMPKPSKKFGDKDPAVIEWRKANWPKDRVMDHYGKRKGNF